MKFLVAIFFMIAAVQVSAQSTFNAHELSAEGRAIISQIENDNSVPSDTMGLRFWPLPKDYPLTLLREKLTLDELEQLTSHDNPIVRCYSFKALTQRNEGRAFRVVTSHLQDTSIVETHYGCLGFDVSVGDYFLNMFRGSEAVSHDSSHLNTLDSILIFTPNKLEARYAALVNAGKKGIFYNKIKELAINDKLAGAVVALASFRRPEDIEIIMHTKTIGGPLDSYPLRTTFLAICQFPHSLFLPFLKEHLSQVTNNSSRADSYLLYRAISSYNSREASLLLATTFQIADQKLKQKHLRDLSLVLKRNSNPVYNDLRKRIASEVKN